MAATTRGGCDCFCLHGKVGAKVKTQDDEVLGCGGGYGQTANSRSIVASNPCRWRTLGAKYRQFYLSGAPAWIVDMACPGGDGHHAAAALEHV